jgi:hypothetical protein
MVWFRWLRGYRLRTGTLTVTGLSYRVGTMQMDDQKEEYPYMQGGSPRLESPKYEL